MSKFCPECANPINDSSMPFCSKCGAKLPSTSPEVQPPPTRQPAVQQPAYPSYIPPVSNVPTKPPVKRSALEWIAIVCGGIILLIIVSVFIAGMMHGISGASSPSASTAQSGTSSKAPSSPSSTVPIPKS